MHGFKREYRLVAGLQPPVLAEPCALAAQQTPVPSTPRIAETAACGFYWHSYVAATNVAGLDRERAELQSLRIRGACTKWRS